MNVVDVMFVFLCAVVTLAVEAKHGVFFRPFLRCILEWRTPKTAREIPLVETFLGQW